MTKSGKLDGANYETKIEASGKAMVRVRQDYPAGVPTPTAQRVWQIVANFGGIKTIFPSVCESRASGSHTLLISSN